MTGSNQSDEPGDPDISELDAAALLEVIDASGARTYSDAFLFLAKSLWRTRLQEYERLTSLPGRVISVRVSAAWTGSQAKGASVVAVRHREWPAMDLISGKRAFLWEPAGRAQYSFPDATCGVSFARTPTSATEMLAMTSV